MRFHFVRAQTRAGFCLCTVSVVAALVSSFSLYSAYLQRYYDTMDLRTYPLIDVAATPGKDVMDAGVMYGFWETVLSIRSSRCCWTLLTLTDHSDRSSKPLKSSGDVLARRDHLRGPRRRGRNDEKKDHSCITSSLQVFRPGHRAGPHPRVAFQACPHVLRGPAGSPRPGQQSCYPRHWFDGFFCGGKRLLQRILF